MAPTSNWLSFSAMPPIEMLLPDPGLFFASASTNGSGELCRPAAHPPLGKLEDFLGTRQSPQFVAHLPSADSVEHTSSTAGEAEDSSSAIGGNYLCLAGRSQETDSLAIKNLPPPAPVTAAHATAVGSCQRTSVYRGVTRHRWTGRFEAHLWDNTCRREGQKRKGRQVYLGGYENEDSAAKAYDLAALKYWGLSATTNFPLKNYHKEMEEMENMTKQEFIASLRRKSSGFSRGASIYRGVTRHHQHGRWQARIGRVAGNKDLYLGTFASEEEAAEAYDVAAIKFRGSNAVTNFEFSRYNLEAIANTELPIGATAKKLKQSLQACNGTQLTMRSSAALLQPNSFEPSAFLHNLLQLQPNCVEPAPLHYYSFGVGGYPDLCNQSLYWLVGSNTETGNQMKPGEYLWPMHATATFQ